MRTGMTEVEVIRRWRGSSVNPLERCGIPDELADELASIPDDKGGPAVRILRRNVPETAGLGGGEHGNVNHLRQALDRIEELEKENAALRA